MWTISSAISKRQLGEEIKESEPLRDTMLMANPQARAWRGSIPLHQKQSGAHTAQVVVAQDEEDEGEHDLEENEASDDELEVQHQEAVAMMTIAKQKRTERESSSRNLSHQKIARPSSKSSSSNLHVRDVGNWAIGKTIMTARPK